MDADAWVRLGRAVRNARKRQGLDQIAFAKGAGVGQRTLSTVENGVPPKKNERWSLPLIEKALGWLPGEVDRILAGGPASDPEDVGPRGPVAPVSDGDDYIRFPRPPGAPPLSPEQRRLLERATRALLDSLLEDTGENS